MTDFASLDRSPSLTARVSDELLEALTSGRLRPGERLPSERDLSEQFGVSRTVIREAVRSLEAKGVLVPAATRGSIVAAVPSSRVAEALDLYLRGAQSQDLIGPEQINEVRTTLETRLVELASDHATERDIDAIEAELERMAEATTPVQAARHDAEFHRAIALATHNALYVTLLESLNATLQSIRKSSLAVPSRLPIALNEHRAVFDAIRARDAEAAVRAMHIHLEFSRTYYDQHAGKVE